jgi:ubiquinone/menaquinone biosynthesis C-methylase UbiE
VLQGVAENLPFTDNSFDFVYCFTVIEHVQDVEKSIQEMIRVTKKGGMLYFNTPDYRQLYEAHYKMNMPTFFPKWMLKIILFLRNRPVAFIDTLQFVTAKQLRNIFRRSEVIAVRVYFPYETPIKKQYGWRWIIRLMQDSLGIETNQFWILIKQ